jgi:hypothetical protein
MGADVLAGRCLCRSDGKVSQKAGQMQSIKIGNRSFESVQSSNTWEQH